VRNIPAKDRLILAVDTQDRESALDLYQRTRGSVGMYKIGLELFIAAGPAIVNRFLQDGEKVFLDLKLHDIPNTVRGAVRSALQSGVSMLTLHGLGGAAMVRAAVEAVQSRTFQPGGATTDLLAVSILTHHSLEDLQQIGIKGSVQDAALNLIELSARGGVSGCVCSQSEASLIRKKMGEDFVIVCPGIRPSGSPPGDQTRTATPFEAIRDGADYLVVGRPIRTATDPESVAAAIVLEIEEGLKVRAS
jgi:orotidine-5'-phosphate decarboxylase